MTELSSLEVQFWNEKAAWHQAGDVWEGNPTFRLERHGARHQYVAQPYLWRYAPVMGFGGALWVFRRLDGTYVVSNDVWHQGEVPHEYFDRLPVNAVDLTCTCRRWWTPRQCTLSGPHTLRGSQPCERCRVVRAFAEEVDVNASAAV